MKKDTIYSRFKKMVSRYPSGVAIVEEDRCVTYAELDAMVDAILDKIGDASTLISA